MECCSNSALETRRVQDHSVEHLVVQENSDPKYHAPEALFTDSEFRPGRGSCTLTSPLMGNKVNWIRAADLNRDVEEVLWDGIHPTDVRQGRLNDCWLIAGLSSMALFPELIESAFVTKEVSPIGKYVLRLWDYRTGAWVQVVVDDFIPCLPRSPRRKYAQPLFASFTEEGKNEIWPMILEKAFAKFVGGYGKLNFGDPIWGWQAMGRCRDLLDYEWRPGGRWELGRNDLQRQRLQWQRTGQRRALAYVPGRTLSGDAMFKQLTQMMAGKNVIASSICSGDWQMSAHGCDSDLLIDKGLVPQHQFSVLYVAEVHAADGRLLRLVLQRNPITNSYIWTGDWGPQSKMWTRFPEVRSKLQQLAGEAWSLDDLSGEFWMSWDDFNFYFTDIDVCAIDGWRDEL